MSTANEKSRQGVSASGRIKRDREPSFVGSIHRRIRIIFLMMAVGFVALAGELFHIQVNLNKFYAARASVLTVHTIKLAAQRGRILDRNGFPLAENLNVADVVADPTQISDPNATASELSKLFDGIKPVSAKQPVVLAPTDLAAKIYAAKATVLKSGQPLRYLLIASAMPFTAEQSFNSDLQAEIKANRHDKKIPVALSGINLRSREVRAYPNGDLGAQILGFVTGGPAGTPAAASLVGHLGIEGKMNAALTGSSGVIKSEQDAAGRVISYSNGEIKPAVSGNDITLTIDNTIQRIAQNELNASCEKFKAQMGVVVVLDPSNGDILALANNPTFDPNRPGDSNPADWVNPAVTKLYEPGSTMKTLTLSAVLDTRGLESMYDIVKCTGTMKVDKYHTIHCAVNPPTYGHHGVETMREVMENSCNIGAYQFAESIGAQKLYEYEGRFGILDKPNSGLPYERYCGLVSPDKKKWPQIELANVAFGQGVSLTPLQVASVYATIANQGVVVHPHILMKQGYTGAPQVAVKPEVAQAMMSMLQSVVQKGTGQPAQIKGYTVGGKTGSAQVFENGHYGNHYVGSFVGVAPVTHPRLVVLCAIFDPKGMHWGAVVAAPVVRNITAQTLRYLRVPQDDVAPSVAQLPVQNTTDIAPIPKPIDPGLAAPASGHKG